MSTKLSTLLDAFHGAIFDNDPKRTLAAIKSNARIAPERQMAIYIEGYRTRLRLAVRSDYPELLALLGETLFDALAGAYVENAPSRHYTLDRYPHPFAAFVGAHAKNAFAAELATLE